MKFRHNGEKREKEKGNDRENNSNGNNDNCDDEKITALGALNRQISLFVSQSKQDYKDPLCGDIHSPLDCETWHTNEWKNVNQLYFYFINNLNNGSSFTS